MDWVQVLCLKSLILRQKKYNLRCKHRLTIPKVQSVKHGYQTVSFRAAIIWNNLPNKYKEKKLFPHSRVAGSELSLPHMPLSMLFYFMYVFIILWSM